MRAYVNQTIPNYSSAFTLAELLITLSIVSIMGLFLFPSLEPTLGKHQVKSSSRELQSIMQLARSHAAHLRRITTVCGSLDGLSCSKDWIDADILVFVDDNNNRHLDGNEELILKRYAGLKRIHWRGSNRKYMRFDPRGHLLDWGRYHLCPERGDFGRQLVFNRIGRSYVIDISLQEMHDQGFCQ